jgi:hypothetical protein
MLLLLLLLLLPSMSPPLFLLNKKHTKFKHIYLFHQGAGHTHTHRDSKKIFTTSKQVKYTTTKVHHLFKPGVQQLLL